MTRATTLAICGLAWIGAVAGQDVPTPAPETPPAVDPADALPDKPLRVDFEKSVVLEKPRPPALPDDPPAWLRTIAGRQSKIRTLAANYVIRDMPGAVREPIVETGTVKIRFGGRGEIEAVWAGERQGKACFRLFRDGKASLWIGGKLQESREDDLLRILHLAFRFPLLPDQAEARFAVSRLRTIRDRTEADASFPTSLAFLPRPEAPQAKWLRRMELSVDAATGLVYALRWSRLDPPAADVELSEEQVDAPLTDANFPPGPPGEATEKR